MRDRARGPLTHWTVEIYSPRRDHPVPFPFEVPDRYGRPWAQIWEKHWEQRLSRPQQEDIFDFN